MPTLQGVPFPESMLKPKDASTFELPFDQYQRYAFAATVIDAWRRGDEPLCILETGAGADRILEKFLPRDRIIYVDREAPQAPSEAKNFVQGDATAGTFREDSFDVVVALDVLEHIPLERREAFLGELLRCARRGVVLGAPFDSPAVVAEETRLNAYFRRLQGGDHRWLYEHRIRVLPDLDKTRRRLESGGWQSLVWGHGNLRLWAKLMQAHLFTSEVGLVEVLAEATALYNEKLFENDWATPVYRHFIVAAPRKEDLKVLESAIDPTGCVSPQALARIDECIRRLYRAGESLHSEELPRTAEGDPAGGPDPSAAAARELTRMEHMDALMESHEQSLARLRESIRSVGTREGLEERAGAERELRESIADLRGELASRSEWMEAISRRADAAETERERQEAALKAVKVRLSDLMGRLEEVAEQTSAIMETLTPPSPRPGRLPRWGALLARLFRWKRHRMRSEAVNDLLREGEDYVSTGRDPQLRLHSSRGRLPVDWVILSWRVTASLGRLEPLLYVDRGRGFREQDRMTLPFPRTGASRAILHLPRRVSGLRLDPMDYWGRFRIGEISFLEVGIAPLALLLAWDVMVANRFAPLRLLRLALAGLRVLRHQGVEEWKQWLLGEGRGAALARPSEYERWIQVHDELSNADRMRISQHVKRLESKPLISVVVVGEDASPEEMRRTIESVRRQLYPGWELCIPRGENGLPREYMEGEKPIKVARVPRGEFIARVAAGDEIAEHALYLIAVELNEAPGTDLLYTDEDRIDGAGTRSAPYFKPGWSEDLLLGRDYISHLKVYRACLEEESESEWDHSLRIAGKVSPSRIRRVPRVLYHARGEVKHKERDRKALLSHIRRTGLEADVVDGAEGSLALRYALPEPAPLVSLVVRAQGPADLLRRCVESIRSRTTYPHYEMILIDECMDDPGASEYLRRLAEEGKVRVFRPDPNAAGQGNAFNGAVSEVKGTVVGLIAHGIEVASPGWLEEMVGHALRPEVGAVGPMILDPDGTILQGGIILGMGPTGIAGPAYRGRPRRSAGQGGPLVVENPSAVSASCLLVRRDLFESLGGLDERGLPSHFSDVDLCLRLGRRGRRTVWTPRAEMVHHGSASPAAEGAGERQASLQSAMDEMKSRWREPIEDDPAYNPNLDLDRSSHALAIPPRTDRPWAAERLPGDADGTSRMLEPYDAWLRVNAWSRRRDAFIRERLSRLPKPPLISVIMPTYNSRIEFLERAIRSVLNQAYDHWELCIADDASTLSEIRPYLERWSERDRRIRVRYRTENGHISAATNTAAGMARGEFLAFLDHDDELTVDALGQVALYVAENSETDVLYSDDDKIDLAGRMYDPQFKPDWSPELLLSYMYLGHLLILRRDLYKELGGMRLGFEGSQDYDLSLRATERARHVGHLPMVLYHWRAAPGSTAISGQAKPGSFDAAQRAVQEALSRRDVKAEAFQPEWAKKAWCGYFSLRFPDHGPSVAILIPTRNQVEILRRCIDSIRKTAYGNYEVVVIDNESDEPKTLRYLRGLPHRVLRIPDTDGKWSFSEIINQAVREVKADYVLLLNNDTEVRTPEWLGQMVGYLRMEGVGAVGGRLLFPDGTIQHAGIVQGYHHWEVGHAFKHLPASDNGYLSYPRVARNYRAVTAACMLTPRDLFLEMGGFDEENFAVAYNDVDYCYRLGEKGRRVVYAPGAELTHHEGYSRPPLDRPSELSAYRMKYGLRTDPYYSPNLTIDNERFETAARTVAPKGLPRIRTLLCSQSLNLEGAPAIQFEIARGLKKQGTIDPIVFSPMEGPLRRFYEDEGIPVHVDRHPLTGVLQADPYEQAIEEFAEKLRGWGVELVYGNTMPTFYAIEAAQACGLPSIWIIHESEPWDRYVRHFGPEISSRAKSCFAYPYKVIFGSQATRALYNPLNLRHNFATVRHGLDGERFARTLERWPRHLARKELGVSDDEVMILLVGTVCERKGQVDLVRAIGQMELRRVEKVRCFIVGDRPGEYSRRLESARRALERARASRVEIVPETVDVALYYAGADIFVCSSRVECFPRVIQEAMSCGLPIVTTPVYGIREQVQEGGNAIFYPPGDVKALAGRLESLLDDGILRQRLAGNSREVLRTHTDHEQSLAAYGRIFREAWWSAEIPPMGAPVPAGEEAEEASPAPGARPPALEGERSLA